MRTDRDIAYLALEIGIDERMPTYAGGLGILAGDTLRAAADLGLPVVGVTLLYRDGYFAQRFGPDHTQQEPNDEWRPESILRQMTPRVTVPVDGRDVTLRAYRYDAAGVGGHVVPVYFLDSDLPENDGAARGLTRRVYGGDPDHRIRQETLLGVGGPRMLRAIGHEVRLFHMNEGHACLATLEALSAHVARMTEHGAGPDRALERDVLGSVRRRFVFTTHTPVPAGHDRFPVERVRAIFGDHPALHRPELYSDDGGHTFNTTRLALNLSGFANAVAQRHGEVTRDMFPGYHVHAITNGVHAASWVGRHQAALFDEHLPGWRARNADLRLAERIPAAALHEAHKRAKADLLAHVGERTGRSLDPQAFTIVFARRMTDYKRPALVFSDTARLVQMARKIGPVQLIFAGKAHPHDGRGRDIIQQVHRAGAELGRTVPVVYIPGYDIALAKKLVAGADLWLNNPRPPLEASGTSGMKAALNGVPSLSTLDGWWAEACVEGVTGWAIGAAGDDCRRERTEEQDSRHAESLYRKLEAAVLPLYYQDRAGWLGVMRGSIAINGSYFTTERMMREYAVMAYC
ncbi:MAG TPA: alpha-glucan family phosphorylase [Phycisphaerales bacterium]|nr:alpha-glucan family phosphorylase [Phycisphaerales bacterium]